MSANQLLPSHFTGISLNDVNNYIETINIELNETLPKSFSWPTSVATLRKYLNKHDFIHNEGEEINDDTISDFINRIISENKIDDLNFLPNNKLVNEMDQPQQQINPLQQLVENDITVQNLLDIYNRYSPEPMTMQDVYQNSNGNEHLAKAYLINNLLTRARDGTLVVNGPRFGTPSERKGMQDIAKIVLDLQRNIKRVKKAISPVGAEDIVIKHNQANPRSQWRLNKLNPQAPASLTNLSDINNDGIPDVVISNSNNQPLFVNGYTTTKSTYPIDLAYYNQYPSRSQRAGHSLNEFKKDLYNVTYDTDNQDFAQRGNVTGFNPRVGYIAGYDMNKFQLPQPKRMSAFNRFKKFVVQPILDELLQQQQVPAQVKLAVSSKACAAVWNILILQPLYNEYHALTEVEKNKVKKKKAAEIDIMVNDIYYKLHNSDDNWSEEQRINLENNFRGELINIINQVNAQFGPQAPVQE